MISDEFLKDYGEILYKTERPSRYIGDEFGSYNKDFVSEQSKFLFAFPDKYEIGISNFGHKIIYDLINKNPNCLCDRVYAPDKDFVELLQKNNKTLYALESKRKPVEFDVVGFGLQYEMCYSTVLKMLEMSQIPVLSSKRSLIHPLVLAGGPCTSNPKPMSKFIDCFIIGDGEEVNIEVLKTFSHLRKLAFKQLGYENSENPELFKKFQEKRIEIIKELAQIEGVYVPLLNNKTRKRIAQLTYENHPVSSPIPHFASIQDRATIELRRNK